MEPQETTVAQQPKRRGRPPGSKNKGNGNAEPSRVLKSELEQKLDYFQYPKGDAEEAAKMWEHGQDVNPLKIPKEIQKAYGVNEHGHPVDGDGKRRTDGLRFHWSADRKWERRGKNYAGFMRFTDKKHPNGVTRGNDLFLTVIPESVARKREQYIAEQSSEKIREMQRGTTDMIDNIERMGGQAIGSPGELAGGLVVGERPKVGKGGGYRRGLQKEQMEEIIAKNRERIAKHRKFFT